jgi:hypothetical protein
MGLPSTANTADSPSTAPGATGSVCSAMRTVLRNLLSSLFSRSRREQHLEQYLLREHARGRRLEEVMNDHYIVNRTSREQRVRLLDRPEIVAAVGKQTVEDLRHTAAARRVT